MHFLTAPLYLKCDGIDLTLFRPLAPVKKSQQFDMQRPVNHVLTLQAAMFTMATEISQERDLIVLNWIRFQKKPYGNRLRTRLIFEVEPCACVF